MRMKLAILVVVLQVLVLAYMAAEREWVIWKGQTIYLQTAPLDPRDPFRGNYVRLDYGIGRVPTNQVRNVQWEKNNTVRRGALVYAVLKNTDGGIASLEYITGVRPADGLFLRGHVDRYWSGGVVPIRYGLEAFFLPEGKAKALESQRWRNQTVQVPLEMEVAISRRGLSVLKGHRWCSLGIGLKLDTLSATNRQIRSVTVQLVNVSSNALALVDLPKGRSLVLREDWIRSWGMENWKWVLADQARPVVSDQDVVVLQPGQQHDIRVDLTQSDWFVQKPGEAAKSLADSRQWGAMFRLVYRPPSVEECKGLKQAALIWHGELPSRSFGGGRVD